MNEVRNLLVGLDIGYDLSRLCFYDRETGESVPCAVKTGTNLYAYPTALVRFRNEWHIGYEALYFAGKEGAVRIPSPYELQKAEDSEESGITAADAFAALIGESLKMLGIHDIFNCISGLAVVTPEITPVTVENLRKAFGILGLDSAKCLILDEGESLYYYGYSQKPQVTVRNMGLFRFNGDEVSFFSMTEMRNSRPAAASVDMKGTVTLPGDPEKRDEAFTSAANRWISAGSYSGIFITGEGFGTEWAVNSVKTLSRGGAHVFYVDSLFAGGACLALAERFEKKAFNGRIFLGKALVRTSVGIDVSDEGRAVWLPLIRAGRNWYENETSCELILDDRNEITFTSVSMDGSERKTEKLFLDGIGDRPPLASRVRLTAVCSGGSECVITVRDLGFGEIFRSTGKTWELKMQL